MPSAARNKFLLGANRATLLRVLAKKGRRRPLSHDELQLFYHASLAASVAAWDAYIKNLIGDFFSVTTDALDLKFNSIHQALRERAENAISKFNTPNWENARNLLICYTGYDPIANWIWPARSLNVEQVKLRLNETLRIRHSFAHGFPLPTLTWTQSSGGKVRLTSQEVETNDSFFKNLVKRSDQGMSNYITSRFSVITHW